MSRRLNVGDLPKSKRGEAITNAIPHLFARTRNTKPPANASKTDRSEWKNVFKHSDDSFLDLADKVDVLNDDALHDFLGHTDEVTFIMMKSLDVRHLPESERGEALMNAVGPLFARAKYTYPTQDASEADKSSWRIIFKDLLEDMDRETAPAATLESDDRQPGSASVVEGDDPGTVSAASIERIDSSDGEVVKVKLPGNGRESVIGSSPNRDHEEDWQCLRTSAIEFDAGLDV